MTPQPFETHQNQSTLDAIRSPGHTAEFITGLQGRCVVHGQALRDGPRMNRKGMHHQATKLSAALRLRRPRLVSMKAGGPPKLLLTYCIAGHPLHDGDDLGAIGGAIWAISTVLGLSQGFVQGPRNQIGDPPTATEQRLALHPDAAKPRLRSSGEHRRAIRRGTGSQSDSSHF